MNIIIIIIIHLTVTLQPPMATEPRGGKVGGQLAGLMPRGQPGSLDPLLWISRPRFTSGQALPLAAKKVSRQVAPCEKPPHCIQHPPELFRLCGL